jgi:hypothetical protein
METMDEKTIKAMTSEEQRETLAAFLAVGCERAGLTHDDLLAMDGHLREWYGEEKANLAALSLGTALAVGLLTADGYRLMTGDIELVEEALSDMKKAGEPMARRFFEGKP